MGSPRGRTSPQARGAAERRRFVPHGNDQPAGKSTRRQPENAPRRHQFVAAHIPGGTSGGSGIPGTGATDGAVRTTEGSGEGRGAADWRAGGRFVEPCRTRASASAATHPRPAAVTALWTAPLMDADILPQSRPAWNNAADWVNHGNHKKSQSGILPLNTLKPHGPLRAATPLLCNLPSEPRAVLRRIDGGHGGLASSLRDRTRKTTKTGKAGHENFAWIPKFKSSAAVCTTTRRVLKSDPVKD